jgi:hypothetical protein
MRLNQSGSSCKSAMSRHCHKNTYHKIWPRRTPAGRSQKIPLHNKFDNCKFSFLSATSRHEISGICAVNYLSQLTISSNGIFGILILIIQHFFQVSCMHIYYGHLPLCMTAPSDPGSITSRTGRNHQGTTTTVRTRKKLTRN